MSGLTILILFSNWSSKYTTSSLEWTIQKVNKHSRNLNMTSYIHFVSFVALFYSSLLPDITSHLFKCTENLHHFSHSNNRGIFRKNSRELSKISAENFQSNRLPMKSTKLQQKFLIFYNYTLLRSCWLCLHVWRLQNERFSLRCSFGFVWNQINSQFLLSFHFFKLYYFFHLREMRCEAIQFL